MPRITKEQHTLAIKIAEDEGYRKGLQAAKETAIYRAGAMSVADDQQKQDMKACTELIKAAGQSFDAIAHALEFAICKRN